MSDGLLKAFAATEQTVFRVSAGCLCCPSAEVLVSCFVLVCVWSLPQVVVILWSLAVNDICDGSV